MRTGLSILIDASGSIECFQRKRKKRKKKHLEYANVTGMLVTNATLFHIYFVAEQTDELLY